MQTQHIPISVNNPTQNPATPQKSGCGCCGCLTGCLFILFLPFLIMGVLYFTVDFGDLADRAINISYEQIFRPKILEPSLSRDLKPSEKQAALQLSDQFIQDYMKLPKNEKKFIREEVILYLYNDVQNKKLSPDQTPHLNKFIETETLKMQSNPAFKNLKPPPLNP